MISQSPTTTPSEFSEKWLFQWHYVIDRIPSPNARALYMMPYTTFNHILDLVLEFDSEALCLGLSVQDFRSEKAEKVTQSRRRYLNPFTPASQLREAVRETLEFCDQTLGYFPNHTLTEPRSRSRIVREEGQLVELIDKVEEAKRQGIWYGTGRRRSSRRRIIMWVRKVWRPLWETRSRLWCF